MRSIIVAFPKIVFAIVLVAMAMVARVDGVWAAGSYLLYALTAPGPTPSYTFGTAVASGDVNGDGKADVIVGAPGENRVHVFSGASGALLHSLSMPTPASGADFGKAIAAGDVNGDGMADMIVAAPSETVGPNSEQGRVYVFSGADGALLRTLDTNNPTAGGHFGSSVAAGDVNGDGKADVVVAALDEGTAYRSGRVYVFSGVDGSLIYTHTSTTAAQYWGYGTDVAAGDIDGDGKADVIVGETDGGIIYPFPVTRSYAHIFSGADGSLLRTLAQPHNFSKDGTFGSAMAVGEVNGDGNADVFVGDPGFGTSYVFDGAGGALIHTLVRPSTPQDLHFGTAIAAGDVDGDGRADAIVGSLPGFDTEPELGSAYVYSGADGSLLFTLNTPNPGAQAAASFGSALASGDVEGNGTAEVIIGAPDGAFTDEGWAYVFSHETDGDGCADARELLLVPPTDPFDPWDFFSVPVPALFSAQYPTTVFHDGTVSALDAEAVWAYFLAGAKTGTPVYEQDLNRNGVRDGVEYDRSVAGPAHGGPPDGAVTAQDAQLALAQFRMGYDCLNAP